MKSPAIIIFRLILLIVLAFGTTISLNAAVDMFIKFDGIDGESKDAEHSGESDVVAWSWGATVEENEDGTRRNSGTLQDLHITKILDKSSPKLFEKCLKGQVIPEAKLVVRKVVGGARLEYVFIDMTNVQITSITSGGSGGEDVLSENVSLYFDTVTYTYSAYDFQGTFLGNTEMTWDNTANP